MDKFWRQRQQNLLMDRIWGARKEKLLNTAEEVCWDGSQKLDCGHIEFELVVGHPRETSSMWSDMWIWACGERWRWRCSIWKPLAGGSFSKSWYQTSAKRDVSPEQN